MPPAEAAAARAAGRSLAAHRGAAQRQVLVRWLRGFRPAVSAVDAPELARSASGALLGLFRTAPVTRAALSDPLATLWLIAPMGASSVLLFAVPASPLAQPWSIFGFAFFPVACNPLLMLGCALAFHPLVGRRYPHGLLPRTPAPASVSSSAAPSGPTTNCPKWWGRS